MSEAILEEMRERLEQKNAFDIFKKKKKEVEETGEMEMRVATLQKNMAVREKKKKEQLELELEPASGVLDEKQAEELAEFFTKKEIDSIIYDKFPIDTRLNMCSKLIQLSGLGFIPKKPKRFVSCIRCGMTKDMSPITMVAYWGLMEKKWYCEGCQKYIDELNAKGKQLPLGL